MKETRVTYTYTLADVPEPRIRTAKERRRYQVAMKRLRKLIDDRLMRAMFGGPHGCNGPVAESYPPKLALRRSWLDIASVS